MSIYKVTKFEVSQPRITKTERWKGHEDKTRTGLEKGVRRTPREMGVPQAILARAQPRPNGSNQARVLTTVPPKTSEERGEDKTRRKDRRMDPTRTIPENMGKVSRGDRATRPEARSKRRIAFTKMSRRDSSPQANSSSGSTTESPFTSGRPVDRRKERERIRQRTQFVTRRTAPTLKRPSPPTGTDDMTSATNKARQ